MVAVEEPSSHSYSRSYFPTLHDYEHMGRFRQGHCATHDSPRSSSRRESIRQFRWAPALRSPPQSTVLPIISGVRADFFHLAECLISSLRAMRQILQLHDRLRDLRVVRDPATAPTALRRNTS